MTGRSASLEIGPLHHNISDGSYCLFNGFGLRVSECKDFVTKLTWRLGHVSRIDLVCGVQQLVGGVLLPVTEHVGVVLLVGLHGGAHVSTRNFPADNNKSKGCNRGQFRHRKKYLRLLVTCLRKCAGHTYRGRCSRDPPSDRSRPWSYNLSCKYSLRGTL